METKSLKRSVKYAIAKALYWVPDSMMLHIQYFVLKKRILHLKHPKRFSEKVQWYKAYYHNPEMLECVDKYRVRDYVRKKLGTDKYLNELYQVCDDAYQIDFDALPEKFVIKTTDGGDGANVLICKNKAELNIEETIKEINSWRNKKYYVISREWAYKGAKQSKVIVEKFLESDENADGSIDDYKFVCYDGKFRFLWLDKFRFSNHHRTFYDENLNWLPGRELDYPAPDKAYPLPANMQEMIEVAEKLAHGFPLARVDLYNIKGKIIFGEMTFYPVSGYGKFGTDEFDYELGRYFDIQSLQNQKG